jgi:hypothetical protein
MINQIKHNSPSSILSQFNPIASLKPKTRKAVNERFILPILESFFAHPERGGIDNFCELDSDKLKTEIEFERIENFVKTYIYKEIVDKIEKDGKKVVFKPKYVITFDRDLTNFKRDETIYPYNAIFNINAPDTHIKYGVIRLGEAPILYYILIDLQQLIKFIKTIPEEIIPIETEKITEEEKRNKLFDNVIFEKTRILDSTTNPQERGKLKKEIKHLTNLKEDKLQGQSGKLRINLAWNTTDDLDLHIITPNGEISYNNKTLEYQGVIGELDIDKNAGDNIVSNPQENINFNATPIGEHKISVHFFSQREHNEVPFSLTIIPENGEGRIFNKSVVGKGHKVEVVTFEYNNEKGKFDFKELL